MAANLTRTSPATRRCRSHDQCPRARSTRRPSAHARKRSIPAMGPRPPPWSPKPLAGRCSSSVSATAPGGCRAHSDGRRRTMAETCDRRGTGVRGSHRSTRTASCTCAGTAPVGSGRRCPGKAGPSTPPASMRWCPRRPSGARACSRALGTGRQHVRVPGGAPSVANASLISTWSELAAVTFDTAVEGCPGAGRGNNSGRSGDSHV
jgi:hypothetical protein